MKSTKDYPDEVINFMRAHPLMYHAVYPAHRQPLVVRTNVNYRFTTIAVDQVDAADGRYEVLFLGTGTHAAHRRERSMLQRGLGGRQGPIPCPAVRPRTPPSSLVPPLSHCSSWGCCNPALPFPCPGAHGRAPPSSLVPPTSQTQLSSPIPRAGGTVIQLGAFPSILPILVQPCSILVLPPTQCPSPAAVPLPRVVAAPCWEQ